MGGIFYVAFGVMFIVGEALMFKTGTPDMMDYFYGMVFFAGWLFSFFPGLDMLWGILGKDMQDSKWVAYLIGVIGSVALFFQILNG